MSPGSTANTQAAQARAELATESNARASGVLRASQSFPGSQQEQETEAANRSDPPRLMGSTSGGLVDLIL